MKTEKEKNENEKSEENSDEEIRDEIEKVIKPILELKKIQEKNKRILYNFQFE